MRRARDIFLAVVVVIGGIIVMISSYQLQMGTLARIGSGAFPFALGFLFVFLGVLNYLFNSTEDSQEIKFKYRNFIGIIGTVIFFAISIEKLGILITSFFCVIISRIIVSGKDFMKTILLAIIVSILAFVIFSIILRLPLPLYPQFTRS